jgi:hypothetical protein
LNHVLKFLKKPKRQNGQKRKQELIDRMEQNVTHVYSQEGSGAECDN